MTADIRELPWNRLQPRVKQPPAVLASVTPEDANSFLRTLAVNPLTDTTESSVVKSVLGTFGMKHAESVLAADPLMRSKRKHPDSIDDEETGSEGEPLRRIRRSTRPKTRQGSGSASPDLESGKSRGYDPKIGANHQADVPKKIVPESRRKPTMTEVKSELVYSPEICDGEMRVVEYLKRLQSTLERRDGFSYSPNGEEVALQKLAKHRGNVDKALEETCKEVQVGREFKGIGRPWTYEEKCLFVRAYAEREKDFQFISRNVLKSRSTSELVYMYYTYQKQQQQMHGTTSFGHIFDTGKETTEFLPRLGPERVTTAVRCLAKTAGDGFPADRRMADAIKSVRDNTNFDDNPKRPRSTRSGRSFAAP